VSIQLQDWNSRQAAEIRAKRQAIVKGLSGDGDLIFVEICPHPAQLICCPQILWGRDTSRGRTQVLRILGWRSLCWVKMLELLLGETSHMSEPKRV
jgi:hypothetical protein